MLPTSTASPSSEADIALPAAPRVDGGAGLVRVLAGLTAVVVVGCAVLWKASRPAPLALTAAPGLWVSPVQTCPAAGGVQARAMAVEKAIAADGKRERHPFNASDGVDAVVLYEAASACLRAAGDADHAADVDATAAQLRADVSDDYRVRQLRLARAVTTGDNEVAAREVVALRALLLGKGGPYVDWINATARRLDVDKE